MTNESPSLNLIQRAADRLAKRASAQSVPLYQTDAQRGVEPPPFRPHSVSLSVADTAEAEAEANTPMRQTRFRYSELRAAGMVTPDNMMSEISNEFRSIKRDLLLRARDAKTLRLVNNLIMVTSSMPKEGKTFVSTNLALSFAAERDLHVLLIDADPVRQSLGSFFEGQEEHGLIDVLAGDCADVRDVMYRCEDVPTLSIVFAGRLRPNAPEGLASRRMTALCEELSTRYPDRMIIIDTPPVLGSAEPTMIALHIHQLIMVIAADQTSRTLVNKSLEAVSACRNITLLLNKAPRWHRHDVGHYYDYYGVAGRNERK